MLTHLDLFSGIGGFSLGFEPEGFRTVAFVENNPIKTTVLKHWWPELPILPDVTDWERIKEFCRTVGTIDCITGGVPCQPASALGQQRGTSDERWLWPQTIRLVREIRPRYAVFENPPALLTLEDGQAWNGIVSELVACGYDLLWDVFPAAAVGAGHLRERVILIAADAFDGRWNGERVLLRPETSTRGGTEKDSEASRGGNRDASHSDSQPAEGQAIHGTSPVRSSPNARTGAAGQAPASNTHNIAGRGQRKREEESKHHNDHQNDVGAIAYADDQQNRSRPEHAGIDGRPPETEQARAGDWAQPSNPNDSRLQGHTRHEAGNDFGGGQ